MLVKYTCLVRQQHSAEILSFVGTVSRVVSCLGLFWRIDRKYEQNFRTITLPDQPSLCSGPGCATASTLPTAIQRSSARPRIDPGGLGSLGLDLGLELCLDLDLGATSIAAGQ